MKTGLQRKPYLTEGRYFLFGCLLGAAVFFLLYGPSAVNPCYDSWILCGYVEDDIIQSYAAWMYLRTQPWDIPLCWMMNVAKPIGASAAYADPFPWAMLLCRLFQPVLPQTFQYFGLCNLLNSALQGGFSWLLIRRFDQRTAVCVPGTLLFCFWPVFQERLFRHTALSSQWVVLLLLYLYFRSRRQKTLPWLAYLAVFILIPGIHAYFLPIAFGLLCAAALENMLRERRFWRPAGLVALCVAASLCCARGLGVIMPNASMGGWGYGYYSMNLNALFNPRSMDLFAEGGTLGWSVLLPQLAQGKGQYDGFNYLGLGVLLGLLCLAVYGLLQLRRPGALQKAGRFALSHIGLVLACAAFTVFAVSNVVYWGDALLVKIPLPPVLKEQVFAAFRASGRIFWPVGYLLGLCVILAAARLAPRRWSGALLALVLAVQLADMSGVLLYKGQYFRAGPLVSDSAFETEEARALLNSAQEVYCMNDVFSYRLAAYLVRENPAVETDIVFFSRGNYQETYARYEENRARLASGEPIPDGALYITNDGGIWEQLLVTVDENVGCWQLEDFYIFGNRTAGRPPETG